MTELRQRVANLRRPRLLIRAARAGMKDYRRDRDLCRILRVANAPSPKTAVRRLLDEELGLDGLRENGDATYSVLRHVEMLIALIAETELLPLTFGVQTREERVLVPFETRRGHQPNASGSEAFLRAM